MSAPVLDYVVTTCVVGGTATDPAPKLRFKDGHIRLNLLGVFSWPRALNRFIPAPMKQVETGLWSPSCSGGRKSLLLQ